jgi:multidrug efflux system membrane fusion protein
MQANPKPNPDLSTESGRKPRPGKLKRFFVLILSLIIIGLAAVLSLRAWEFNERHPRTDDAVSRANVIGIAPRVSGPITRINVTDNQFVKGGDILFEIDPADFQLNVDRAKSALDALDQQIETAKAQDAAELRFG